MTKLARQQFDRTFRGLITAARWPLITDNTFVVRTVNGSLEVAGFLVAGTNAHGLFHHFRFLFVIALASNKDRKAVLEAGIHDGTSLGLGKQGKTANASHGEALSFNRSQDEGIKAPIRQQQK